MNSDSNTLENIGEGIMNFPFWTLLDIQETVQAETWEAYLADIPMSWLQGNYLWIS